MTITKTIWPALGAAAMLAGTIACGGDDDNTPPTSDLVGDLTSDLTWSEGEPYVLKGMVYVRAPAVLTLNAGTVVKGEPGSALVITSGARIVANGTKEKPIIMTSASAVGARKAGDWGGLVLLGSAPINVPGGTNEIEGIDLPEGDPRIVYGGTTATHDCGTLKYVRIEYAGFELTQDNELNGLTLGGCGSATKIEHVQVHKGKDDGIEFFGGNPTVKWAVISAAEDDSLDWDFGFTGKIQHLVVLQDGAEADSGIEADNNNSNNAATPRSNPTIFNATFVGINGTGGQNGMVLRRGTWVTMRNSIVMGFPGSGVDVRDTESAAGMTMSPPMLSIESSIFFDNGKNFDDDADSDDDGGADEAMAMSESARSNRMDVDPMLPAAYERTAPGLIPASGSPAGSMGTTPPSDGFFDAAATHVGAFAPGGANWMEGWTDFSAN